MMASLSSGPLFDAETYAFCDIDFEKDPLQPDWQNLEKEGVLPTLQEAKSRIYAEGSQGKIRTALNRWMHFTATKARVSFIRPRVSDDPEAFMTESLLRQAGVRAVVCRDKPVGMVGTKCDVGVGREGRGRGGAGLLRIERHVDLVALHLQPLKELEDVAKLGVEASRLLCVRPWLGLAVLGARRLLLLGTWRYDAILEPLEAPLGGAIRGPRTPRRSGACAFRRAQARFLPHHIS